MKKALLKAPILFLIILVLVIAGCSPKEQVSYDFTTYLSGDSEFEKNVALVMPSKEELENSKVVYYVYYDNCEKSDTFGKKMIQLTVEYSDEDFSNAVQKMKNRFDLYDNGIMNSQFFYNGVLYDSFSFRENDYCAIAYNTCSDSNTISYIAFDSLDLEFMDVASALKLFTKFESEPQLISLE